LSLTAAVAGVAVAGQIVHGQPDPPAVAVVNDHETVIIVLPAVSRAPLTVAVYSVDAASAFAGRKVTVRVAVSYVVVPATAVLPARTASAAVPA
jgi:hypothetical protein